MVNNSTNINKTNNHLSPKESLNCDGQQFHQYQQNDLSHITSSNIENTTRCEIQVMGRAEKCGRDKPIYWISYSYTLDNQISWFLLEFLV